YGIESFSSFLFLRPPGRMYQQARAWSARESVWDGPCSRHSTDQGVWLSARDEATAVDGYRAGRIAAAALASGSKKVDKCPRDLDSMPSCETAIADLAKSPPNSIEPCDAEAGVSCYKLDL